MTAQGQDTQEPYLTFTQPHPLAHPITLKPLFHSLLQPSAPAQKQVCVCVRVCVCMCVTVCVCECIHVI